MFYDVYVQLCGKMGKSPSAVATDLGINKSNVSNWKNNGYTPRGAALQKIADYFGVSTSQLLQAESSDPYSDTFRSNLTNALECMDTNALSAEESALADFHTASNIASTTYPLSLAEACEAVDIVGESMDVMLGLDEKKPTPEEGDGHDLSDIDREIIRLLQALPEDRKQQGLDYLRYLASGAGQ